MSKAIRLLAASCLLPALFFTAPGGPLAQSAAANSVVPARVIVKYKTESALSRMQALSASDTHAERAQALGARLGMTLRGGVGVGERTQVVFASGVSSEALAERLARESDVEYAVPDRRKQAFAPPNDARYLTVPVNGPAVGQWYLRAPQAAAATTATTVVSAINAEAAWDITTGSNAVVVAVLDTGIRFDHADLRRVINGGNLLDGYDMLSDDTGPFAGTFASAGDGNGRDADASDTGDWVTPSESASQSSLFYQCPFGNSSWHGTQVAGLIGALTNNAIGMASVGRNVRILPVRVLGKCGGYDSDILAGMRWAAGIAVPGVPANMNPAKVINMSLGGTGTCSAAYQSAVNDVMAAGAIVVASAGNGTGHATAEPANCAGVVAVGGLRHVGSKVGYSDLGPEVAISAPAGNCVNASGSCLYPILTTSNSGTTTPVTDAGGGSIYTDSNNATLGTSFSAPLVAGTAALMWSVQPSLTPQAVRQLLKGTARAFPASGAISDDGVPVGQCSTPQYTTAGVAIDQGQCYCNKGVCGAGMLDAAAAVQAAASGVSPSVQARIDVTPVRPQAAQTLTLTALNADVPTGRSVTTWQWTLLDGGGIVSTIINPTSRDASVTASAAGRFTVGLTVTDSALSTSTSALTVAVAAAPLPAPAPAPDSGGGGGGGGALGFGWLLSLMAAVFLIRRTG